MIKTIYRTIGIPKLDDMKALLKIACQTTGLSRSNRAGHVLRELTRLLGAEHAAIWIIDSSGRIVQSTSAGKLKSRLDLTDDIAAELVVRTTRKKMPLIKSRSELINHDTWTCASAKWVKQSPESIYSLQRIDSRHRSLIAIYSPTRRDQNWNQRAIQLTQLIHNQTSRYFCTEKLYPSINGKSSGVVSGKVRRDQPARSRRVREERLIAR